MSTTSGQMVSHYRLVEKLGEGGMGVVWRALDTRLGREVALKTLPAAVAGDEERLARFEREARALAALNHPNIAAIYGIEHPEGGPPVLVLELVAGETLDQRLASGPLSLDDALALGLQLAGALEAAHELGIVHRDLKPANIKLTPGDQVKVLDFGLVKVLTGAVSGPGSDPGLQGLTEWPTVTSAKTRAGAFLGTIGYMSPEQARGRPVDRRADIWAFGCVLFEALAGRPPFGGDSPAERIGALLHLEPDWSALPDRTPGAFEDLLRRCLEKDPRSRLRDIGEARIELERLVADRASRRSNPPRSAASRYRARRRPLAPWLAWSAGALLLLAAFAVGLAVRGGGATHEPVSMVSLVVPPQLRLDKSILSPNGRAVLLVARGEPASPPRLFVRRLDEYAVREVQGSRGVVGGGFTGDGRWIIFAAPAGDGDSQLKVWRMPSDFSAPPVAIMDWDPSWTNPALLPNGDVFVLKDGGRAFVTVHLPDGKKSAPVRIQGGPNSPRLESPFALPDGRRLLLNALWYTPRGFAEGIALLDVRSGQLSIVTEDGGFGAYSPTGHLVFTRGDTLLAAPFDPARGTMTGAPTALMSDLRSEASWMPAVFALREGTLMFQPGGLLGRNRRVVRVMDDGSVLPLSDERRAFEYAPAVSPDHRRVAVVFVTPGALYEIWIADLAGDEHVFRRLVASPNADCFRPAWSPDGSRLAYLRVARDAEDGIYVRDVASGTTTRVLRLSTDKPPAPAAWTPDGRGLVLTAEHSVGDTGVVLLRLDAPGSEPRTLIDTNGAAGGVAFSPDARFIAWDVKEGGGPQVYVARWSADGTIGTPMPVGVDGASGPSWNGNTLFFVGARQQLMRVAIGPDGPVGRPSPVVDLLAARLAPRAPAPTVLPDGSVLVLQRGDDEEPAQQVNLVLNFDRELKRRVPR